MIQRTMMLIAVVLAMVVLAFLSVPAFASPSEPCKGVPGQDALQCQGSIGHGGGHLRLSDSDQGIGFDINGGIAGGPAGRCSGDLTSLSPLNVDATCVGKGLHGPTDISFP